MSLPINHLPELSFADYNPLSDLIMVQKPGGKTYAMPGAKSMDSSTPYAGVKLFHTNYKIHQGNCTDKLITIDFTKRSIWGKPEFLVPNPLEVSGVIFTCKIAGGGYPRAFVNIQDYADKGGTIQKGWKDQMEHSRGYHESGQWTVPMVDGVAKIKATISTNASENNYIWINGYY